MALVAGGATAFAYLRAYANVSSATPARRESNQLGAYEKSRDPGEDHGSVPAKRRLYSAAAAVFVCA